MDRYKFGKNWNRFIKKNFNSERVECAKKYMLDSLLCPDLKGKSILDIGCGSGIHSLAALRAGARFVVSMDYDPDSVKTAWVLWDREGRQANWKIIPVIQT